MWDKGIFSLFDLCAVFHCLFGVCLCFSLFLALCVWFILYLCCLLLFLMGSMFYVKVIITLLTNFARCKVKFLLSLQTYF